MALVFLGIADLASSLASLHLQPTVTVDPPEDQDGLRLGQDALTLERPHLCQQILDALATHKRVLVTAPPGAGKSSMIQLLEHQLGADSPASRLLRVSAAPSMDGIAPSVWLVDAARRIAPEAHLETLDEVLHTMDYIFIDDAQHTYEYSSFWSSVIKSDGKAQVALFASVSILAVHTTTPAVPYRVREQSIVTGVCELC